MSQVLDVFNDDAFALSTLTAAINNIDHVPGRAGELVFAGNSKGIPTTSVSVERVGNTIELIATTVRGSPSEQERESKRELIGFNVPQIKLEETIQAHRMQDIRAGIGAGHDSFGDRLRGAQSVINNQMRKMTRRHDLTIEHHRLGALKGVILDADGSVLLDLFTEFGFLNSDGQPEPETFDFELDDLNTELRTKCSAVIRAMGRNAKMEIPTDAKVWAFVGDNFFDKFLEHPNYKRVYDGTASAKAALGDSYVSSIFEFGGIFWENYRGTDDNATVAIDPNEARFFYVDAPGIYQETFSPADFWETVNEPGLPRYAKVAVGPTPEMQQWAKLHTQQNPLPLCLRPSTLMKAI